MMMKSGNTLMIDPKQLLTDYNCKVTGRAGVQSFGGAQLINLTPFQPLPNRW